MISSIGKNDLWMDEVCSNLKGHQTGRTMLCYRLAPCVSQRV